MSLEELARTILSESSLLKYFWAYAVITTCYVMNKVLIRPILKKIPYELFNGRKPNISHLKVFGYKCYILNNGNEFLGYSLSRHAYRVYNKILMTVEESIHVVFYEANHTKQDSMKKYPEEDDHNTILKKLEPCPEKQPVEMQNNLLKLCIRMIFQRMENSKRPFYGKYHWTN